MSLEKKLKKAFKNLDKETISEIESLDKQQLESLVVQSNQAIAQAEDELHANPNYSAAKDAIKDLSQGLKEVKKRQQSKIVYALHMLESKDQ